MYPLTSVSTYILSIDLLALRMRAASLSANSFRRMRIHFFGSDHFDVSEKFYSVVKHTDYLVRQQDL